MEEKEIVVTQIWEEVFGKENTKPEYNFFELGGDSIMALKMSDLLRKKGYKVSLMDVFDTPTLKGIIDAVVLMEEAETDSLLTDEQKKKYPATNQQKWFFKNIRTGRNEWCEYIMLSPKVGNNAKPEDAATFLYEKKLFCNYSMVMEEQGLFFEMSDEKPEVIYIGDSIITEDVGKTCCQRCIHIEKGKSCCMLYNKQGDMMLIYHHLFMDAISMKTIISVMDEMNATMDCSRFLYAEYAWSKYKESTNTGDNFCITQEDSMESYNSEEIIEKSGEVLYEQLISAAGEWGVSPESILLHILKKACEGILKSSFIELERIGRDVSGKWNEICGWMSFSKGLDLSLIKGNSDKEICFAIDEILRRRAMDNAENILEKEASALAWNYIGNVDWSMSYENYEITGFGQFSGRNSGRFSPVYCGVYFEKGYLVCNINYETSCYSQEQMKKLQENILRETEKFVRDYKEMKTDELNTIYEILGGLEIEGN